MIDFKLMIGENKASLISDILQNLELDKIHKLFEDNNWTWWNIGVPSKATITNEIAKNLSEVYNRGVAYLQDRVKAYRTLHPKCRRETALKSVLEGESYNIFRITTGRFEYFYNIEREDSSFKEVLEVKLVPFSEESWSDQVHNIKLENVTDR